MAHKYLMLDSRIVEWTENARLMPGKVIKNPNNPLFCEDKPWEVRFDNLYANVLFDEEEGIYKCWYSPFILDERVRHTPREMRSVIPYRKAMPRGREMGICYAVSEDGITWRKPDLGIVEFEGSKRNNIVARGPHGAGIWKDRFDPDSERRYKMFARCEQMAVAFSPDGLHWSEPILCPEIQARGDTHNNTFWSPELGKYVGITRLWDQELGVRIVGRTESEDFLRWSKAVEVLRSLPEEGRRRQTYAMPVFRYADLYIGLLMMFNTDTDTVDCELAWSADTINWQRVAPGEPLIPRGPEGSYDCGCIFGAAYPIMLKEEIRIYYSGSNGPHSNWRDGFFCLAHLRPDGFACMEPKSAHTTARIMTKPIKCIGRNLCLSADAAGGSIRVAIPDIEGFGLNECELISSDVTDQPVRWRGGNDLSDLIGRRIRLLFELNSAHLYAFSFS